MNGAPQDAWTSAKPIFYLDYIFISYYNRKVKNVVFHQTFKNVDFDVIVGTESRGFIFGVPIAYAMGKPFVPCRKKGKLPCETVTAEYDLEYGSAAIELHKDSIKKGQKVVIVDDLIATGGTVKACASLVEELGGEVAKIVFLMELAGLKGREQLSQYDVSSLIIYEGK